MASLLMHLYVGNKFATRHRKIADLPQFYLGCIIPDYGETKEIRWFSHIRSKDIKEWYENNINFYQRNVGKINNDLLLGYIIHNITDAAFAEFLNVKTRDFRFDYDQRKELWWTNEVLPELKKAVSTEINGINKSLTATHTNKIEVDMPNIDKIIDDSNFIYPEGTPVIVTVKMMDELSDIIDKYISLTLYF